ncbi:MAG: ABC transporter substrate-binding protein [Thermodesulfobacteriota bacterium]
MMKNILVVVVALFTVLTLFCAQPVNAEVRGVTNRAIKIGIIFGITGPTANLGVQVTEAARTYVRYINDHGGVNGRQLDLCIEDDRYSIPPALAALKKLVYRDKVFTMIGPGSASCLNVLWKHIEKEKLPTMSIVMPEVAFSPAKRYIFGVMDIYPGQVKLLVDYMIKDFKLKDPMIAVVYPDTETGKIDLVPTIERLKKYNLTPVTKEVLNPGAIDASSQVMNIKRYQANAVVHVGTIPTTTVPLLKDLRKYGLKIPVFGSWGAMIAEDINLIGEAANQFYSVHATSQWDGEGHGVETMRKITLQYHPGTGKTPRGSMYTHTWICINMLVEGLKRAGKNLDEEALISALEGIKNYDTGGLCGPITYSSTSHKGGNSWKIYKADPISRKWTALTGWKAVD